MFKKGLPPEFRAFWKALPILGPSDSVSTSMDAGAVLASQLKELSACHPCILPHTSTQAIRNARIRIQFLEYTGSYRSNERIVRFRIVVQKLLWLDFFSAAKSLALGMPLILSPTSLLSRNLASEASLI